VYYPDGDHEKRPRHARSIRRRRGLVIGIIVAVGVLIAGTGGALVATGTLSSWLHPVEDFTTAGTGSVEFTIHEGDIGEDIARNLEEAGVTKSFDAFYRLLLKTNPSPVFIPGVYSLKKQMSASAALAALLDENNRLVNQAVIPEGTILSKVLTILAQETSIPRADFVAAASNPQAFGLPKQAKTLEGFLFPATYNFSPNQTADQILQQMVDRCFDDLNNAGVAPEDQWRVITFASLIQKESGSVKDMYKVSRVFTNRLDADIWPSQLLESDATVAYGTGHTNMMNTTAAERADAGNPYNTYVHPGMLSAPISNPGADAIDAALHPVAGKWLFFVAVNFDTGETVFSETLAQHERAVAQSQEWWQAHPEYQ
jgi:UPF0755 protein